MVTSAQGLDVSNYNGRFDWAGAKKSTPGLAFGICRATQGLGGQGQNSPDPELNWNWEQIKAQGLYRGAYHFLNPYQDGAAQARYFASTLHGAGLTAMDMLWMDSEISGSSPAAVAACGQAFMNELGHQIPGNPRGVYSYISFIRNGNCAGLGSYPLWLAYPSSVAPAPPPEWTSWTFWQWGQRNGADTDAFNGTASDLANWLKKFGTPVPLLAPAPVTLPQVQQGETGQAVKTVQALCGLLGHGITVDGDFGPDTAIAVRAVQTAKLGAAQADGIVGPKTWAVLVGGA